MMFLLLLIGLILMIRGMAHFLETLSTTRDMFLFFTSNILRLPLHTKAMWLSTYVICSPFPLVASHHIVTIFVVASNKIILLVVCISTHIYHLHVAMSIACKACGSISFLI